MGAKSLTPAAKAPEQAGETDWKAVALSLKEKIDGLGQILIDNGFERPEDVPILTFAGETIVTLVVENKAMAASLTELTQLHDARGEEIAKLTAELDKVDALLESCGFDPAKLDEGQNGAAALAVVIATLTERATYLEDQLGAATAKVETLEGQAAKPAKGKGAGKKPRAIVLALPAEPVKAIDLALAGPTAIVFSEDGGLIDDIKPIAFDPAAFRVVNGRAMLTRRIDIDRDVGFARIDHAWLTVDGKPVSRCEVPGGIVAGGGRGASFAADSLIFA
ncbi:hypothetical protein [Rhizorhabdus histidinilytica]|uniref:hypothetical protein n=1 Tax=Rhizorhabdus histidinilytica TaxID=439228 RepID=UPI001ADB83CF|nr:hypothetical protein [Rhizorhabdus histidinilytica]